MTSRKISVQSLVPGPIEEVWHAYTSPEDIMRWNAASDDWHCPSAAVDLREGGTFFSRMEAKDGSMGFDFAGTYTKLVECERIEYSFGGRTAVVEFLPNADAVLVRVTFDAENTHPLERQRDGWQAILDKFARHVRARQARRGHDIRGGLR